MCAIGQIAVNRLQYRQTRCWSHVTFAMHRLHIDRCMYKIAKHLHLFWCQDIDGSTLDSNVLIVHFSSEKRSIAHSTTKCSPNHMQFMSQVDYTYLHMCTQLLSVCACIGGDMGIVPLLLSPICTVVFI